MTGSNILLEILCKEDGTINWAVTCVREQWGSEEPPEGPLLFDADERTIQIVSPESVGLADTDIQAYVLAENTYQDFCDVHADELDSGETGLHAEELLQEVERCQRHIQTAIEITRRQMGT